MPQMTFRHFPPQGPLVLVPSLDEALELRKQRGGFVWLSYEDPGREDLAALVDALGLHPLSIEDCFDDDHLPKIGLFPGYAALLFDDFRVGDGALEVGEIDLFLGKDFLVSVTGGGGLAAYGPEQVLPRLVPDRAGPGIGSARLLYALLDLAIDRQFSAVEGLGDRIAVFEDSVLSGATKADSRELHELRRSLATMRKSLFHEREVLVRICRGDCPLVPQEELIFFVSLYDHLAKFVEIVESDRETMTNLVQIQLAMANNAMAEAANRTNASVNRLTLITTIFMPLSLIAGIGGMSEWTMMTGPENWRIAYPALLGLMAVLGLVDYLVLKRLVRKS